MFLTLAQLARGNPLETASVLVLAVGGVVFPILPPLWLIGSLIALASRLWDRRDKAAALLGPLVLVLPLAVLVAVGVRGHGHANFVQVYIHAVGIGFGYLLRIGCLIIAAYLGWRVHQGPRMRIPPWRR